MRPGSTAELQRDSMERLGPKAFADLARNQEVPLWHCTLLTYSMMMGSVRILVTITFVVAGLWSQTAGTAAIRGQVLDPSGASVPAAKVALENTAPGIHRDTQTDFRGYFTFADLPLTGEYPI